MTPKEKARKLFNKMHIEVDTIYVMSKSQAKQCALIAVDLAIEYNDFHIEFLQEVKQEIEKL
jgi:ethanolamine utilization microcompartment shell protein EutS